MNKEIKIAPKYNKNGTFECNSSNVPFGDSSGIRTPDTLLKRQVLCRLS